MNKYGNVWNILEGVGPVIAVAVHDGHRMDDDFRQRLALSDDEYRRDEDPMTGMWVACGDTQVIARQSRFQLDLNRSREKCVPLTPEDAWGLHVWNTPPDQAMIDRSQRLHDAFYLHFERMLEDRIETHGAVLVLDLHSYNHRRDGPDAPPADPEKNPDVDLGVTTLDKSRFGSVVDCFTDALTAAPIDGRTLDVRENVRYPDGGHFPEWIFANYGGNVAALTIEFKKFYMNEWTGMADLAASSDIRIALEEAVWQARKVLADGS